MTIIALAVLLLLLFIAVWVFIKIEHFLVRICGGFFMFILIAVGIWYFFLRH